MSSHLYFRVALRPLLIAAVASATFLAAGSVSAFAQSTTDIYPAICQLDVPADLYGSDATVSASIAQVQSDCQAATGTTPPSS